MTELLVWGVVLAGLFGGVAVNALMLYATYKLILFGLYLLNLRKERWDA